VTSSSKARAPVQPSSPPPPPPPSSKSSPPRTATV
jgi:hypothetical protein